MPTQQTNLYEQRSAFTALQKLGFYDWLMGNGVDTDIWRNYVDSGAAEVVMADDIDEGLQIRTGAASASIGSIDFNGIRPFSHTASLIFLIAKRVTTTNAKAIAGFNGLTTGSLDGLNSALYYDETSATFKELYTSDGSTSSKTDTDVAVDTSFHNVTIECGSANIKLSLENVLKVTKTTNRPTSKLQPVLGAYTTTTAYAYARYKYVEALNL